MKDSETDSVFYGLANTSAPNKNGDVFPIEPLTFDKLVEVKHELDELRIREPIISGEVSWFPKELMCNYGYMMHKPLPFYGTVYSTSVGGGRKWRFNGKRIPRKIKKKMKKILKKMLRN